MFEILLYCLIILCITSGLFGILECLFVNRFIKKFFQIGKVVFKDNIALSVDLSSIEIENRYKNRFGSYKFVSQNECLYYTKYSLGQFDFFPIKGRIIWNDNLAKIDGRLYLGIFIFAIAWMLVWTAGGMKFISYNFLIGLIFVVIGWIFVGGIFYFGSRFGHRYTLKFINEIRSQLAK